MSVREWMDAAVVLLLAPSCAACGQPLATPTRSCVCNACWDEVDIASGPCCPRCGDTEYTPAAPQGCLHCQTIPPSVARVRALGAYAGALRNILHALKYDSRRSLAAPLAARMQQVGRPLLDAADAAVPVPLHARRRRERGFNQAADLAAHLGLPVVHALARVRPTPSQTTLHAEERHANVRHAFRATRRAGALHGKTVVLVDDVRTTGATLDACASALKAAGVREVLALTAARVESSRQP